MKMNNFLSHESFLFRGVESRWSHYFNMWGNSRINISGSSRYNDVSDSSRINNMWGSSRINMSGNLM